MKLGGVIYLYDMSQPRLLKNLEMFQVLCGTNAAKAIVLGMTKSEELPRDVRKKREGQLRENFWSEMIMLGTRMERFEKTTVSAWKILYSILGPRIDEHTHPLILQIRKSVEPHPLVVEPHEPILQVQDLKQLVELEKILSSTVAGKRLRDMLRDMLENFAEMLKSQPLDALPAKLKEKMDSIKNLACQISDVVWQHIKAFFTSRG